MREEERVVSYGNALPPHTIGSDGTIINAPWLAVAIPRLIGEDSLSNAKVITSVVSALRLSENCATLNQFLTCFTRIITPVAGREATLEFFATKWNDTTICRPEFGAFTKEQFFTALADSLVKAGYPTELIDVSFEKVGVRVDFESVGISTIHDSRMVEYPAVLMIKDMIMHLKVHECVALLGDSLLPFNREQYRSLLFSPSFIRKFARVVKTPGVLQGMRPTDAQIATALSTITPFTFAEILRFLADSNWKLDDIGLIQPFSILTETYYDLARSEVLANTLDFDRLAENVGVNHRNDLIPVYSALTAARARIATHGYKETTGEPGRASPNLLRAVEMSPQDQSVIATLTEAFDCLEDSGVSCPANGEEVALQLDAELKILAEDVCGTAMT